MPCYLSLLFFWMLNMTTDKEPAAIIDMDRMDKALASETIYPPAGMTREETRQFIIAIGQQEKSNADSPRKQNS